MLCVSVHFMGLSAYADKGEKEEKEDVEICDSQYGIYTCITKWFRFIYVLFDEKEEKKKRQEQQNSIKRKQINYLTFRYL